MIDRDLILAKASAVEKHLNRVKDKVNIGQETFLQDIDLQEIVCPIFIEIIILLRFNTLNNEKPAG